MSSPTASRLQTADSVAAVEAAIRLENVSVRYRVPRERIATFKEYAIRRLRRKIVFDEFWALRSVSIGVRSGEVFGVIGRNGAGKSTLLKVVARVLRPTEGRVRVVGRVAPLLELGAGFDWELTGRENVYLNGAILGFKKRDLSTRFSRIIEFSGLREFADAPLRTYSSGMIARLGFAVATDVQPDVLLVDEVLAVGDAEFHRKSTDRILGFSASGATIVLVTHDLPVARALCQRVAWLERGQLMALGAADEVVSVYEESSG